MQVRPRTLGGLVPAAWVAVVAVVSAVGGAVASRISLSDLRTPLGEGDYTFYYALTRSTIEHGFLTGEPGLGSPIGQDLAYFPLFDQAHLLLIRLLGLGSDDPVLVLNVFVLLGFSLTGVSALALLAGLGVRAPLAAVLAVSFATLPWHVLRSPQVFLASYWSVPLALLLVLALLDREVERRVVAWCGGRRGVAVAGGVVAAVLVATAGIYYAVMAAGLAAVALLLRLPVRGETWRPAHTWSAVLVGGAAAQLLFSRVGLWLSPPLFGGFERLPVESQVFAGQLGSVFLPWTGTVAPRLDEVRREWETSVFAASSGPSFEGLASHGLVAVAGAWLLVTVAVVRLVRRRDAPAVPALLAALFIVVLLVWTSSGVGSIIAHAISPELRSWGRYSIFVGALATAGVGVVLDGWLRRRGAVTSVVVVLVLGAVVVADQWLPAPPAVAAPESTAASAQDSRAAVAALDERYGPDCPAFQYPAVRFPEEGARGAVVDYEYLEPYVVGGLESSYGGVKGTRAGEWATALGTDPGRVVAAAAATGFCSLEVLDLAVPPDDPVVSALPELLGPPVAEDPFSQRRYFDLLEVRAELDDSLGADGVAEVAEEVLHPVVAEPLLPATGRPPAARWTTRLHNTAPTAQQVEVSVPVPAEDAGVELRGGDAPVRRTVQTDRAFLSTRLEVPAGGSVELKLVAEGDVSPGAIVVTRTDTDAWDDAARVVAGG